MPTNHTQEAFEADPDNIITRLNAYLQDVQERTGRQTTPDLIEAYRVAVEAYLDDEEAGPGILYGFGLALTKGEEQRSAVADAFYWLGM